MGIAEKFQIPINDITELPEFVTMNRMYRRRNFQMVTISMDELDQKDAALKILRERHVATTNYISTVANRDRFADLLDKEWPGPLPYTLVIAPGGKVLYRKSGPIDPLELRRVIVGFLGRTYASRVAKYSTSGTPSRAAAARKSSVR